MYNESAPVSRLAVIVALIVAMLIALGGVLYIAPGPESTQRLGALFGILGIGVAAIVGLLKADQAATQTNGKLDARIQAGVHRAMNARRRGDDPETPLDHAMTPPPPEYHVSPASEDPIP